jgi:hypothetical protein
LLTRSAIERGTQVTVQLWRYVRMSAKVDS